MTTLAPENPLAKSVEFAGGVMRVALEDGRRPTTASQDPSEQSQREEPRHAAGPAPSDRASRGAPLPHR